MESEGSRRQTSGLTNIHRAQAEITIGDYDSVLSLNLSHMIFNSMERAASSDVFRSSVDIVRGVQFCELQTNH